MIVDLDLVKLEHGRFKLTRKRLVLAKFEEVVEYIAPTNCATGLTTSQVPSRVQGRMAKVVEESCQARIARSMSQPNI